jgi:hypothetical protein
VTHLNCCAVCRAADQLEIRAMELAAANRAMLAQTPHGELLLLLLLLLISIRDDAGDDSFVKHDMSAPQLHPASTFIVQHFLERH